MARRILIVPDKFKGSLDAINVARAIASGWMSVWPNDIVQILPMSDGGDGFGVVMANELDLSERSFLGCDAARRDCEVPYWVDSTCGNAVVEAALSNGLSLLPNGEFHPFDLDTWGVGKLLLRLGQEKVKECLVGVGGSATNDAGFGMARALGWRFLDIDEQEILKWTGLSCLESIIEPESRAWPSIKVASDVLNPLLGPNGSTWVYGPQKGLKEEEFGVADKCFERLAMITADKIGNDFSILPGAGAAGGLGFGMMAFADAKICSGFELFAERANLESKISNSDIVITAEGKMDSQTLMGKGTGQVASMSRSLGKHCIGLAGQLEFGQTEKIKNDVFWHLASIVPEIANTSDSISNTEPYLKRLASDLAKSLPVCLFLLFLSLF